MKKRNLVGLTTLTMAAAFATGPVAAQEDPTALGGGKKPYVLVIIDSSASMEYTDHGDNRYPIVDNEIIDPALPRGDGIADTMVYPLTGVKEWYPGTPMEIDATNPADGPSSFGTCFVWEPEMPNQDCGSYQRPSWRPPPGTGFSIATSPTEWHGFDTTDTQMWLRFQAMRDGHRLQPEAQPRHVTIKEVLTGDMIMLPENPTTFSPSAYDSRTYSPGCWFVPRQRDASVQPKSDQTYCEGVDPNDVTPFEVLPDHDTPLPHFQEVYDLQKSNGVLDRLGTSAIFAVAAFDSYRDDVNWDPNNLNDEIGGTYPPSNTMRRTASHNEESADCNGDGIADDPCYNLGLWRIITPTDLEIPTTYLPELSAFTQIAINDTGYLNENDDDEFVLNPDHKKSEDNAFLGATFSKGFKKYIDKVDLGKQPIARATPLAAAIHDTHQFFAQVQDDSSVLGKDAFKECRPKHVVVMTDGKPEPERGDPTTLNEAFGYDVSRYVYDETEVEINAMLDNPDLKVASWDADDLAKYGVRAHVVGLNLGTDTDGDGIVDDLDDDAIEKMARMAIEGQSCAELLVEHLIPPSGTKSDGTAGTCQPGTGCLVDQSAYVSAYAPGYLFTNPATGETDPCVQYPALILDNNEPSVLAGALFSMFSALIDASGIASRTRLVVTNRLDDVSLPSGGQYRVYSGVKIGGSAWWKGILNRTTIKCDATPPPVPELSFDSEVATQVSLSTTGAADSRRIWTTVPHTLQWCFDCKTPEPTSDYASLAPRDSTYIFTYDLNNAPTDEFQDTYIGATDPAPLLGTRIPFEYSLLENTYGQGNADPVYEHFNAGSADELRRVINVFRSRIEERAADAQGGTAPEGRAIGGILNSNPVIVGPPNLDLPIGSYRNFRARYADRATMLYVSSMDGLLHAIHTGRLDERVNVRQMTPEDTIPAPDATGSAEDQREAWAYMPFMLHRDLADNQVSQAYFMDGSPQVKDVRLCNQDPSKNQNEQACTFICPPNSANCDTFPSDLQWRTVLVQGRGLAGAGYYAMDITRPGGLQAEDSGTFNVQNPDPITLWEFDREWERVQVEYLYENEPARVAPQGVNINSIFYNKIECNLLEGDFWKSPLMGLSVSEPEIATILVDGPGGRAQRPVAVFGGGANIAEVTECGADALGMAIYVVDLQTGSLLRRFTSYEGPNGNEHFFGEPHEPADAGDDPGAGRFVGSPALFDSSSGAIATRGFIGDSTGRLFKMNFISDKPTEWKVSLFFDPNDTSENTDLTTLYESQGLNANNDDWGPASFKPAIALNPDRDVMVVYGLGEVGDTVSNNQGQAILALTEDRADTSTGVLSWAEVFPEGEKLTGAPTIFNRSVYFSTYALPDADVCEPGTARVWGLRLPDQDPNTLSTVGAFLGNETLYGGSGMPGNPDGIEPGPDGKWFGPEEPTLIRGVTITLGEMCTIDNAGTDDPTFSSTDRPRPQLVAQTSGTVNNDLRNTDQTGAPTENVLDRVVLDIDPPRSQSIPLSWSIVSN